MFISLERVPYLMIFLGIIGIIAAFVYSRDDVGDTIFMLVFCSLCVIGGIVWIVISKKNLFRPPEHLPKERVRYQTFAAVLHVLNGDSCQTFWVPGTKKDLWALLYQTWGIADTFEAIRTARYLSMAEGHTPYADEVFDFIKKNEEELLATINKSDDEIDSDPITLDLSILEAAFRDTAERVSAELTENLTDDEFFELVVQNLFTRIGAGLQCYVSAKKTLIDLGYTEEALSAITSVAAWDYGRCGFVARYSANAGYLSEDEAWAFMKGAATNASRVYSSWHEYMAAYILGRAIAFEDDSSELYRTMKFLLFDEESPYRAVPFKDF